MVTKDIKIKGYFIRTKINKEKGILYYRRSENKPWIYGLSMFNPNHRTLVNIFSARQISLRERKKKLNKIKKTNGEYSMKRFQKR